MRKNLKDYSKFKYTNDDFLVELRVKCMKEMYAKAQPSANYDDILKYYKDCEEQKINKIERIYDRYYLSFEEQKYIINKYKEAYNIKDHFREDCDILIRDLKEGYTQDFHVPPMLRKNGQVHGGDSTYYRHINLAKIIGKKAVKFLINFIKDRKDFYRFDRYEEQFSTMVSLGDSPNGNEQTVINYWKSKGVDLKIDPRHYTQDDFWSEENGYFNEEDENCE